MGTAIDTHLHRVFREVHPHGRGDGSSLRVPRIRCSRFTPTGVGTALLVIVSPAYVIRFTPTGVGTAGPHQSNCGGAYRFTPTGVGTAVRCLPRPPQLVGSPPRAWGRLSQLSANAEGFSVHPHGRGDGERGLSLVFRGRGSPPRAWGRLERRDAEWRAFRFTPTGVGTALGENGRYLARKVHPHGRGDGTS